MNEKDHYNRFQEGILRAGFVREELREHPTEYFPEKVRKLNKSYISIVKEIIREGEYFLDKSENFEVGLEVASAIEAYKNFLKDIGE
tara:strand:- start:664 stop:924 length:261 start_codon:yes stop_codon:yes gene_type:complete